MKHLALSRMVLSALFVNGLMHIPAAWAQQREDVANSRDAGIDEIVVTATRRNESIQDVPYNISAYDGGDLAEAGVSDLSRFSQLVPGLAYLDTGPRTGGGNNGFIMRGLNATAVRGTDLVQQSVAPVSTYLGETPVFFNFKLTDLERVEVLRGPQGTLYGSGSLGGTIRFIPRLPELGALYSEVTPEASITDHSAGTSYDVRGLINIPLGDRFALRAAGGEEHQAGFIDEVQLAVPDENGVPMITGAVLDPNTRLVTRPVEDANEADITYARIALLGRFTENVTATLHYNYQTTETQSRPSDNPGFPGNQEYESSNRLLAWLDSDLGVVGLDIDIDLPFANLTSNSSYHEFNVDSTADLTGLLTGNGARYFNYPRFVAATEKQLHEHAFTQEVRLLSKDGGTFDWIVGAFYQDQTRRSVDINVEDKGFTAYIAALDPINTAYGVPTASIAGLPLLFNSTDKQFKDTALFGNLTWHITQRWQVTGGARAFRQEFNSDIVLSNPWCFAIYNPVGLGESRCGPAPDGRSLAQQDTVVEDQIYSANTSYELGEKTKAYLTWAQGFRRGGVNAVPTVGLYASPTAALTYDPDTADNWEVGIKGFLPALRLQYTLGVYYIQWNNFQFDGVTSSGAAIVDNGGDASSRGVELEVSGALGERVSYGAAYSYTDAHLDDATAGNSSSRGRPGDPLPGVPESMASVWGDYTHPLSAGLSLNAHVDGSYKGDTVTVFNSTNSSYFHTGSYSLWNAALGVRSTKGWEAQLFVDNATDTRAVFGGTGPDRYRDQAFYLVNRPRTVGVRGTWRFE